jgi:hypothetical protein
MDIDVDQAVPRGDLVRYASGKYIYRFPDGELDIDRFNRDFNQYKEKRKATMKKRINEINEYVRDSYKKAEPIIVIDETSPFNKNRYLLMILVLAICVMIILYLF